ncbi:MAG: methylated-DNA--[protein]-cysteine S-methyltransferase [Bacilli bacterium]|nr:methylated-DNA--[protein]-cysteine S-methyltransferase [Bacilli bacterium]
MVFASYYHSPIGTFLIASKDNQIIGVWLKNQKYYLQNIEEKIIMSNHIPIIIQTKQWLDRYFDGEKPNIKELTLNPVGSDFRKKVWKILTRIPYGTVTTYKRVSEILAKEMNIEKMSIQAVGSAIGHNPISIIIPCHRVIGTNGTLVGYSGGLDKKDYLLNHEKEDKLPISKEEGLSYEWRFD